MLEPETIRNNYLVFGLTDEQLQCVATLATERRLEQGETLCRKGDPSGEMYIVLDGRLKVSVADDETVAEIGPNSVVGEMGLIDKRPRSANVLALTDVRLAAILSNDLREEMVADINLGFLLLCNLTRVLSDRLREADLMLDTLMESPAQTG